MSEPENDIFTKVLVIFDNYLDPRHVCQWDCKTEHDQTRVVRSQLEAAIPEMRALAAQLREKTEENERTQTLRNLAEAWWVAHRAFEDSGGIGNAVAGTHAQEALIKELTGSWLPFIVPEFAAELATARAEVKRLEDLIILYDDWLPGCEDDALVRAEASVIRARRLEKL